MKASEIFDTPEATGFDRVTTNVSYIVLNHNRTVAKTIVVSEHCNVDLDAEGYPVGIEVI